MNATQRGGMPSLSPWNKNYTAPAPCNAFCGGGIQQKEAKMSRLYEWFRNLFRPKRPPVVPPSPPVTPPPITGREMLDEVNRLRASRGRSPFTNSACLESQAEIHAAALSLSPSIGHVGFQQRADNCRMGAAAENIAWGGIRDAAHAVQLWSTSSGHLGNMLDNSYREFGGAVVNGAACMIVGTPSSGVRAFAVLTMSEPCVTDQASSISLTKHVRVQP